MVSKLRILWCLVLHWYLSAKLLSLLTTFYNTHAHILALILSIIYFYDFCHFNFWIVPRFICGTHKGMMNLTGLQCWLLKISCSDINQQNILFFYFPHMLKYISLNFMLYHNLHEIFFFSFACLYLLLW